MSSVLYSAMRIGLVDEWWIRAEERQLEFKRQRRNELQRQRRARARQLRTRAGVKKNKRK